MTILEGLAAELRRLSGQGGPLPPERLLAEQFQVSRHQLRRAMAIVRAEGALPDAPPRGRPARRRGETLVETTSPLEVIEVRQVLEPALAGFAAMRASPREIARIQRAAITIPGMDTGQADLQFHIAIAEAARNVLATDLYILLREVGTDARLLVGQNRPLTPGRLSRRDQEHQAIAAAIAARNIDAAQTTMRAHLHSVEEQVRKRLSQP